MRGFRRATTAVASGALRHAVRWEITEREDGILGEHLRTLLRRYGALPLSRVTALLADDVLEIMPNVTGGLRRYLQERPSHFQVEMLPSGVSVVILTSELRRAGSGFSLISKVLAIVAASPRQQMSVSQLFRALPALEQRKCGSERTLESFLLQHTSLVTVHNGVIKAAPTAFMARKGISAAPPPPLPPSAAMGRAMNQRGLLPEAPMASDVVLSDLRRNKLLVFLQRTVPFSFYIPLRVVMQASGSSMCFSPGVSVEEILEELQGVPATILDCRVVGDGLDDVFLRMMDAERRPYIGDELKVPRQYAVLPLGATLLNAFRAYAAEKTENLVHLQSGIAMSDLGNILGPEIMQRLDIYETKQKHAARILLFDRLRHLFDVNMTAYMVRPWEVLPAHAQPSSLTWQTTPVPVLLRHSLMLLNDKPLSPDALFAALSPHLGNELHCAYASVEDFVANHSLYLFMKDGLVWTPYLAAASEGARVPGWSRGASSERHLSDSSKAQMLVELMPLKYPVDWTRFRVNPALRELPFDVFSLRPDFFERQRSYFRVYEVFGTRTLVVGRYDGTPPPAELLQPPCKSLGDLVRQMALLSIDGAQEMTIMNHLSKEARVMIRRYGTLEEIARQLPMWFDVRREREEQGSAIISYIAADEMD